MGWTIDQKKAIDTDTGSGNLLVSAAAGSGKTAVLVERVLEKILNGKLSHLKFYYLRENTYEVYRELMSAQGVSPNQLKPVRLIDNDFREKFFF